MREAVSRGLSTAAAGLGRAGRTLRPLVLHPRTRGVLLNPVIGGNLAAGLVAVHLSAVVASTFGTTAGVRWGAAAAVVLGILLSRSCGKLIAAPRVLWLGLAAATLIAPLFTRSLLAGLVWLPESAWQHPWTATFCGFCFGLLSVTIPAALLARWTALTIESRPSSSGLAMSLVGWCLGLCLMGLVLAPALGTWIPAWVALLVVAVGLARWPVTSAAHVVTSTAQSLSFADGIALAGLSALAAGLVQSCLTMVGEATPGTLSASLSAVVSLLAGSAVGLTGRSRTTGTIAKFRIEVLVAISLAQLLVGLNLVTICLWLSGQVTSPLGLECCRWALVAVLVGPVGWWFGRALTWDETSSRFGPFVVMAAGVLGGWLVSDLVAIAGIDPLLRIVGDSAALLVLGVGTYVVAQAAKGWTRLTMKSVAWRGAVVMAALAAVSASSGWQVPRWSSAIATKMLFSTPVRVASRGDWPRELLPYLDDGHCLQTVAGSEGMWSLWMHQGAQLHLRKQGIPAGSLTTRPDWTPQSTSDVMSTLWPLALVDQPARVRLLGAGSSAALRGALAFPVSEVVCDEADVALLSLLEGEVADRTGLNPFASDRVTHRYAPARWLVPCAENTFDVIVSEPGSLVLPDATASVTTEFYRRAAGQLSARGIFCQRLSTVDFGPRMLLTAVASLQQAFSATAALEVGPGEFLLVAAQDPAVLVRSDLPKRLEAPHVLHVLSRCNWDWSVPLNLPAYDHRALAELVVDAGTRPETAGSGWLSFFASRELDRWAPKAQETAALMTKPRTSPAVYPLAENQEQTPQSTPAKTTSRQSRYLAWIGPAADEPELLRRLAEVVSQRKLVGQFPDAHGWEYRKELREQLQDHPRSGIQPVSYRSKDDSRWHPEDRRRKAYFAALGEALQAGTPSPSELEAIEELLDPYDPLLTYFAHQELAELYSRGNADPFRESSHRLHSIYYAPAGDASVRIVVAAIEHLASDAGASTSDGDRFRELDGLLQTLRGRWEQRCLRPQKSARVTLQEISRSLVAVEGAMETMATLAPAANVSADQWRCRELVLERILVRPFRSYRDQLIAHSRESERKTRELLHKATNE